MALLESDFLTKLASDTSENDEVLAEIAARARSMQDSATRAAASFHDLARQLYAYGSEADEELLYHATWLRGQIHSDEPKEGSVARGLSPMLLGANAILIFERLPQILMALDRTEAETLEQLTRTRQGLKVANLYREQRLHDAQFSEASAQALQTVREAHLAAEEFQQDQRLLFDHIHTVLNNNPTPEELSDIDRGLTKLSETLNEIREKADETPEVRPPESLGTGGHVIVEGGRQPE